MSSKLHTLLTHEYFWRTMTASIFGAPPLDVQPPSWREFFKLRYGLRTRMCYSGRWKSSPGQPEVTYDFLITLVGQPNPVRGEERYLRVRGAIRWTLIEIPDTYEWISDRVQSPSLYAQTSRDLTLLPAGGLGTRIRLRARTTPSPRACSSLQVLLSRRRYVAHRWAFTRRSGRGFDRYGSV